MNDRIPAETRDAIHAELDADTAECRATGPADRWTAPKHSPSPLLTLRTPAETLEALQTLAATRGAPLSALARGFILDGLAAHRGENLRIAIERLEHDLAAVKVRGA